MANMTDEFGGAMALGGTDQLWKCPDCRKENVSDFAVEDDCICSYCTTAFPWSQIISSEQIDFLESQMILDLNIKSVQ